MWFRQSLVFLSDFLFASLLFRRRALVQLLLNEYLFIYLFIALLLHDVVDVLQSWFTISASVVWVVEHAVPRAETRSYCSATRLKKVSLKR